MTLGVGIVTPRGVVIAADGLLTVSNVQVPVEKVFTVGQAYGIGLAGSSAALLFGGLCSDGPFLAALDNRGNSYPLFQSHYHAIGNARDVALVLMQAYAAYDYDAHPLDTSVLLAKRVVDQVSAAIPAIGG